MASSAIGWVHGLARLGVGAIKHCMLLFACLWVLSTKEQMDCMLAGSAKVACAACKLQFSKETCEGSHMACEKLHALQAVPSLIFWEVRRKDFWESMAHHFATLGLIVYSYHVKCVTVKP